MCVYSILSAALIIASTFNVGDSFNNFCTTFIEAVCGNPNMTKSGHSLILYLLILGHTYI